MFDKLPVRTSTQAQNELDHPHQTPAFTLAGVTEFSLRQICETQLEQNYYGVLALQGLLGTNLNYQIAAFSRYSTLSFHPDETGHLIYNGIASRVSEATGPAACRETSPAEGRRNTRFAPAFIFRANARRSTITRWSFRAGRTVRPAIGPKPLSIIPR